MKEFSEKHIRAVLIALILLLALSAVLAVMLLCSYRSAERARESELVLSRSEYKNTVGNLMQSLENGNASLAYHYARSASDEAAELGDHEASALFASAAGKIMASESSLSEVKESITGYLSGGQIQQSDAVYNDDSTSGEEIRSVSVYRIEEADRCVIRLFGEHNPLKRERKSPDGEFLYSCTNAYAVIDSRTALPIEAAVSLPPAEKRLGADECIGFAYRFLETYFPADISASAYVTDVKQDDISGTYEITMASDRKSIALSIRRDNGRAARLNVR